MVSETQNPGTSRRGGLFDSLKMLTATLIAIAHTRLELLSTKLEEARAAQLHAGVDVSRVILQRPWRRACNAARCARAVGRASAFGLGPSGDPIYPWGVGLTNFFVPGNRRPSPPPPGLWLLHRFSSPCAGHCLLNTRPPQLARELQIEGFAMNDL